MILFYLTTQSYRIFLTYLASENCQRSLKYLEISPLPLKKTKSEYPTVMDRDINEHHTDCKLLPAACRCISASWIAAQLPQAVKAVSSGKWKIYLSNGNIAINYYIFWS